MKGVIKRLMVSALLLLAGAAAGAGASAEPRLRTNCRARAQCRAMKNRAFFRWLVAALLGALGAQAMGGVVPPVEHGAMVIDQLNKRFVPRVSVVRTGTAITFPNSDRMFPPGAIGCAPDIQTRLPPSLRGKSRWLPCL